MLEFGKNEDRGVYRLATMEPLCRVQSNMVYPGQYAYLGDGEYKLNCWDVRQGGVVARYVDDDGDLVEVEVRPEGETRRLAGDREFVALPAEDLQARVPRGEYAQVAALRRMFRK